MRSPANSLLAASALWLASLFGFAGSASAQLLKVEAGASNMVPSVGGSVSLQGPGYESYLGMGTLNGQFEFGGYAKTAFKSYQITAGDQNLGFQLPTDIFGGGEFLTTRGVGTLLPGDGHVLVFAGVTTLGAGTPLFQAFQDETPLALIFVDKPITKNLHFFSRNILSQKQTWIEGLDWTPHPWLKTAIAAGAGSNSPYFAASVDADRNWYEVKAAYIDAGTEFRRITTPSIFASEPDGGNILVNVKPYSSVVLTAGHESFLAPQGDLNLPFERASVDQFQSSFELAKFRLGAGMFESHSPAGRNASDGFSVSRDITRNVDAGVSYYANLSGAAPRANYLISTIHETISPKLSLLEVINRTPGNTQFLFGGSYTTNRFAVSVDYQTLYMPFLANPLVTGIGVTLHLNLFAGLQVDGSTFRSPDGKLRYTGYGTALLTPNLAFGKGAEKQAPKMGDYVVRGQVRDEKGSPIGGAAIQIGEEMAFSNEAGEFLLRVRKKEQLPLMVVMEEFLNPLNFTVVSAPHTVMAAAEDSAQNVLIVLRPAIAKIR